MAIRLKLKIEKPYELTDQGIGEYLRELKQTKKEIEKYDFTFECAGLSSGEQIKEAVSEISGQIRLCEHYFITKKRKDLFKWVFQEKVKPSDWDEERDVYTFSNGLVKGIIEIFKIGISTKIVYELKSDCELYLHFRKEKTYKNLRSEQSIKEYIEEVKKHLEEELKKVEYDKREKKFIDFVLNQEGNHES